jgi:hypothetical protein
MILVQLEREIMALVADKTKFEGLWRQLDFNNNGSVSLAGAFEIFNLVIIIILIIPSSIHTEIDKFVAERYPLLNHKPALMRAYKRSISREGGGDGDDWVVCRAVLMNDMPASHSQTGDLYLHIGKARIPRSSRQLVLF